MRQAIKFGFFAALLGTSACALIADIDEGKPVPVDLVGVPTPECKVLPECTGGGKVVLAMNQIWLGDTNPDGTIDPTTGWKQYGFNLDNRLSSKTSTDLCDPSSGGVAAAAYPDGNGGIDNAFGKNILPIWLGVVSDVSAQLRQHIANGEFTYMIAMDDIGQGEPCSTRSTLFTGAPIGAPPLWNGKDSWPIDPDSLKDPADKTSAKTILGTSAIVGDVFTSCQGADFDWILTRIQAGTEGGVEFTLRIPIHNARFQMQLDPDHQGATSGIIGGIIDREELINATASILGAFDPKLCDPQAPARISILNQMRQAADIMRDGSQNPDQVCDGISIGLGFTMKRVELGDVGASQPALPDPCAP